MGEPAIHAEGLSKRFRLGASGGWRRPASARAELWALRDVGFEVAPGEALGVIGRNGAGKSTLLKILARIMRPSEGRARLRGRVGSLLEVGTGFHPELSGRENVFLNGAILGMRRAEIRAVFDEIVAFSEVERFLDTPVKRYSSGMRVRLAFAVAAHLDPEILIVDEVLAVGDAAFQAKCLGRMGAAAGEGRTVLFVSHNLAAVQALCGRGLLLEEGRVAARGDIAEVVDAYLHGAAAAGAAELGPELRRSGDGRAVYRRASLHDARGRTTAAIGMGEPLSVELEFECRGEPLPNPSFGVAIHSAAGQPLLRLTTGETLGELPPAARGGRVRLDIERLDLLPGSYYLTLGLSHGGQQSDLIESALRLEIVAGAVYPTGKLPPAGRGFVLFAPCKWQASYE